MASSSTTSNPNIRATLHAQANGYDISAYVTYEYIGSGSGYTYIDTAFPAPTMSLGSGTTYSDTSFANDVHNGVFLGSKNTTTFSRTAATAGQKTITWVAGAGIRNDFEVSLDTTITIASGPTGPFISSVIPGTNSFTMTGGVESIGTGGTQISVELVVLNSAYIQAGLPQRYEGFSTLSATKTVSNSSPASGGGITISPNSQYYIGVYANNGAADLRYDGGTAVTLAEAATVSAGTVTETTADINYSTSADGGFYNKTIEYSIDGGMTWSTGATVSTGSASSGSFTITGLSAGTTYSVQTRTTTTAGSSVGSTLSITTVTNVVLYGSVNGNTKKINKLYGPVSTQAYIVTELSNNTNFDVDKFTSEWLAYSNFAAIEPNGLYVGTNGKVGVVGSGYPPPPPEIIFSYTPGAYNGEGAVWGFSQEPVGGSFTSSLGSISVARKVSKLYGSVNGSAKLIYEDNS